MAFDTENQRRSALNTAIHRNLPIATGIIGLDARAMMLFQYAHDSFPAPVIITKQLKVASISLVDYNKVGTITFVDQYKIGDIEFVC